MKIVIEEKTPVLAVSPSPNIKTVAVFTDEGSIIGKDYLPVTSSKKIYSVITYDDYTKWNLNHVKYLTYLSKFLESFSGKSLVYIDIRNPDDVYAQLKDFRLRIGELNHTVFKRSERIESILSEASKLKNQIDYIDLRWEHYPSIKLKQKEKEAALNEDKANH